MNKFMTATSARKNFFEALDTAKRPGSSVTITREGLPTVVMMSFEEFEGWQETMEIMADPSLVKDIQKGIQEVQEGKTISFEALKKQLEKKPKKKSRR